jgi:hypothetical protein
LFLAISVPSGVKIRKEKKNVPCCTMILILIMEEKKLEIKTSKDEIQNISK